MSEERETNFEKTDLEVMEDEMVTKRKVRVKSYKRRTPRGRTVTVRGYTRSSRKTGTRKYTPRSKRRRTTTGTKKYTPRRKRRR